MKILLRASSMINLLLLGLIRTGCEAPALGNPLEQEHEINAFEPDEPAVPITVKPGARRINPKLLGFQGWTVGYDERRLHGEMDLRLSPEEAAFLWNDSRHAVTSGGIERMRTHGALGVGLIEFSLTGTVGTPADAWPGPASRRIFARALRRRAAQIARERAFTHLYVSTDWITAVKVVKGPRMAAALRDLEKAPPELFVYGPGSRPVEFTLDLPHVGVVKFSVATVAPWKTIRTKVGSTLRAMLDEEMGKAARREADAKRGLPRAMDGSNY